MSELTEKRNRETRSDIVDAAIALFRGRGFGETSMEQIADAAGVSRRTVYRHFPTKDELVFEHPRRWFETMEAALATRGPDESTRDLYRRSLLQVAATIQATAESVLAAYSVLVATPSLGSRHSTSDALWMGRCAELIAADLSIHPEASAENEADGRAEDGAGDAAFFQAGVAAGALVGATNAVIALWAAGQPTADIVPLTEAALDQIDSIWPAASRVRSVGT